MVEINRSQMTAKQGTEKMRFERRITKTRIQNDHNNIYDIFVNSSTVYFIARHQCKWKRLCLFQGNNDYLTKWQLKLRQQH